MRRDPQTDKNSERYYLKPKNVLRARKTISETKKIILVCYLIVIFSIAYKCWTISPKMRKRQEINQMYFYCQTLIISIWQIKKFLDELNYLLTIIDNDRGNIYDKNLTSRFNNHFNCIGLHVKKNFLRKSLSFLLFFNSV